MEVLEFLQSSSLMMWFRGSPSILAYPTVLASHTIGMAFLVGITTAISLRTLGFAPGVPLAPLNKFFPVVVIGFWMATLSGSVLLVGEATRFLVMPAFYIKLVAIVLALVSFRALRTSLFGVGNEPEITSRARMLAIAILTFWAAAIVAGRAMAYWSVTGWKMAGVFLLLSVAMIAGGRAARRVWNGPVAVAAEGEPVAGQSK